MSDSGAIQIAKLALSHLGANIQITAFDEDLAEARQASLWYDPARRQVLSGYDWTFARKINALALHPEAPTDNWDFRYSYPSDCLKARQIETPQRLTNKNPVPFEVAMNSNGTQRTILTSKEQAILRYTFDNSNTDTFSEYFKITTSYLLASYMASGLQTKRELKTEMLNIYLAMLRMAEMHDANEGIAIPEQEASWIEGR
jgi:hypothetical protein